MNYTHNRIICQESIPPTWLYVKQHNKTGLKYFGKTSQDPLTYLGSGTRWRNHLNKHGYDVTTELLGCFTDTLVISQVAIKFSIDNNIVESEEWANCRIENGLDGGSNGPHSAETRKLISEKTKGRKLSAETRAKMSVAQTAMRAEQRKNNPPKEKTILSESDRHEIAMAAGRKISKALTGKKKPPRTDEHKRKLSLSNTGKVASDETRKKMSESGKGKPKSAEHNRKNSDSHKGKVKSDEARKNMSAAAKNRTPRTDFSKNSAAMKWRVWWNNGEISKREKECPGEGWIRGQLFTPTK